MHLTKPLFTALAALTAVVWLAPDASASIITFTSRPVFDLAAGALPTETFEAGNIVANSVTACGAPLDSSTNDACFSSGSILAGIQLVDNPGPDTSTGLALTGAGFGGTTSKAIFANLFTDTLDLNFASADSVGLDVLSLFNASIINVEVFGTSGSLGVFSVAATNAGTFFGVINTSGSIVRLNLSSQTTQAEGADNVSFGNQAAQVPEPASLTLLGAGLVAWRARRRRSS